MKVTQENKSPLFPREVGVESGTQEFVLVPCTRRLDPPGNQVCSLSLHDRVPPTTHSSTSAAAPQPWGLSCPLHSCPRALWEQLEEDKGMGEYPPTPTSWGDLASLSLDPPPSPRQLSLFCSSRLFLRRPAAPQKVGLGEGDVWVRQGELRML